jgi:hypothetical protein
VETWLPDTVLDLSEYVQPELARNRNVKNGEEGRNKLETLHPSIKTNRNTTRRRNE